MDPNEDVMADIRAAMNPEPEVAPQAPEPAPVDAQQDTPQEPEKAPAERERGPDGKFVAKSEEKEQDTAQEPQSPTPEPPSQAVTRAPSSWSPAAKAQFESLSPDVKQAIAKREQEIDQGLRRKSEELKRYEPLDQVLEPRRALWAAQGMDEVQAVKLLLAAQDLLEKNPVQGIVHLAKAYQVNLSGLTTAQPIEGQAQAPQPAGNSPQIDQLMQRIDSLTAQVQQAQSAPVVDQIEAFRNDPANLYFDNVRPAMAVLIQGGQAKDLKEAYEMACWMDPTIRPLLQKPQVQTQVDTARAERAKAAAASVTGSPSTAPVVGVGGGSVEDDIRRSFQELAGLA